MFLFFHMNFPIDLSDLSFLVFCRELGDNAEFTTGLATLITGQCWALLSMEEKVFLSAEFILSISGVFKVFFTYVLSVPSSSLNIFSSATSGFSPPVLSSAWWLIRSMKTMVLNLRTYWFLQASKASRGSEQTGFGARFAVTDWGAWTWDAPSPPHCRCLPEQGWVNVHDFPEYISSKNKTVFCVFNSLPSIQLKRLDGLSILHAMCPTLLNATFT